MKRIILFNLIFLIFPLFVFGQNFTFKSDTLTIYGNPGEVLVLHADIENISQQELQLRVSRDQRGLPGRIQRAGRASAEGFDGAGQERSSLARGGAGSGVSDRLEGQHDLGAHGARDHPEKTHPGRTAQGLAGAVTKEHGPQGQSAAHARHRRGRGDQRHHSPGAGDERA